MLTEGIERGKTGDKRGKRGSAIGVKGKGRCFQEAYPQAS